MAANLGDDADTTAAITGQIAGAYYGFDDIPEKWIEKLTMGKEIIELALLLMQKNKIRINKYGSNTTNEKINDDR